MYLLVNAHDVVAKQHDAAVEKDERERSALQKRAEVAEARVAELISDAEGLRARAVPVERVKELMAEAHSLGMSDDSDSQAYAKYEALLEEVEPKKETKPTPVSASTQYVTREEWERALHEVNQRIERRLMHDDVAAEFVTREEFDNLLAQTTEEYMTVLERLEKALAARPTLDELRPVLESLRWAARGAHRPLFDALLNGRAFVPVDDDGRCTTCGLVPEEGVTHLCPSGFNGTRARGLEVLRKHPLGGWLLELLKEVKS